MMDRFWLKKTRIEDRRSFTNESNSRALLGTFCRIYRDPGIPAVIPRAGEILDFGPWAKVYAKCSIALNFERGSNVKSERPVKLAKQCLSSTSTEAGTQIDSRDTQFENALFPNSGSFEPSSNLNDLRVSQLSKMEGESFVSDAGRQRDFSDEHP
jgi:hypothetical protein